MSHKRNEALRHVQHSMHHVIAAGEGSDRAPDSCKLCPYYRPDFKFRTCLYTAHPEIPAVGNYITLTGKADRIDPVFRTLQVGDTVVPFEDLVEISGEGIMEIDQYLGITEH